MPERPAAFRDRGVGLIGPRIRPRMTDKPNITERYDAATSVYDLGDAGGAVGPDEPVRYLTSAVLFARVEALQAVDGFDASMRFGEDLDLVSRLRAAGWTASYDPSVEATHACRRSFHKLLRLHFNYNRPHGELSRRHGENRGVGRLGIRTLLNAITGPWLVPLLVLSIWFPTLPVAMLLLLFGRYYLEWRDKLPYMSPITWTVMRLLDSPRDIAMLAPLYIREILYRLLRGPQGHLLHDLAMTDSQTHRVTRAIEWLNRNFDKALRIDDLAREVNLSPSTLHHRFKEVTALSPLQYQKQLRLQEARRLMLSEGLEVAVAGHRVGYESPSQFSREYSRLFGAPPLRDLASLRNALGDAAMPA